MSNDPYLQELQNLDASRREDEWTTEEEAHVLDLIERYLAYDDKGNPFEQGDLDDDEDSKTEEPKITPMRSPSNASKHKAGSSGKMRKELPLIKELLERRFKAYLTELADKAGMRVLRPDEQKTDVPALSPQGLMKMQVRYIKRMIRVEQGLAREAGGPGGAQLEKKRKR